MGSELHEIIDVLGEGLIYQEADGGVRFCNQAAQAILGLSPGQDPGLASGSPAWDLIHEDGSPCPAAEHPATITLRSGRPLSQEIRGLKRPDGGVTWLAINTRPIFKEGSQQPSAVVISLSDHSAGRQAEEEKALTAQVLNLVNEATDRRDLLQALLSCLKEWSGCQAAGIRLREGDDFPYFHTSGFPASFVRQENSLCLRDEQGRIRRDAQGHALLDCMCGNVLQGRCDPTRPFFTNGGSFWSNRATQILAPTSEAAGLARAREGCNGAGYESVALVPLRGGGQTFGLIQLNDERPGRFDAPQIAFLERLAANVGGYLARMEAEERLRHSEERYRAVVDKAADALFIMDENQVITDVNRAACASLGYSREELLGLSIHDVDPRVIPDRHQESFWQKLSPGESLRFETQHRRKDGSLLPVEVSVSLLEVGGRRFIQGLARDISERKRAEEALRQSQAAMQGLLDATTDSIQLLNRDYEVLAANQGSAQRLGLSLQEMQGKPILDFMPPEVARRRRAHLDEVLATGKPLRYKDQRLDLYFDNHLYPVTTPQGEVTAIAVFARDITQAVRDGRKRRSLERQLQQAQKMEALGTLAGGIAHDFNNILGAILGFTEMALGDARRGQVDPHDLEQVLLAGERAKALVRQILTFSRKVEVEMKPLDLNQEVRQAAQLLGKTVPEMIEIEVDLDPALGAIDANANQLEQILLNLGANAAEAMPKGGRLTFKTQGLLVGQRRCQTCGQEFSGPYVVLTVSDTGQGIDPQALEHIFEPFYTTKALGRGTGLGLSTVYAMVKGHGGHMTCHSSLGDGTAFSFYFPQRQQPQPGGPPAEPTHQALGGHESILLVDDEEVLLLLGARLLTQAGYHVRQVSSGEEALAAYRAQPEACDLVILDLDIPGMGGRRALDEILALDPWAKVILASKHAVADRNQADGAKGFVAKPFRRAQLLALVRGVLDQP